VGADADRVVLADVSPAGGEGAPGVLLSLHHQAGLRATPGRVKVEPAEVVNPADPIPFVRLRVDGPVSRVTLTWEKP
jgi:hypothetical protein